MVGTWRQRRAGRAATIRPPTASRRRSWMVQPRRSEPTSTLARATFDSARYFALLPDATAVANSPSGPPLSPEERAQHRGRLVVGLEPLAQEARQRKEAVDGAGIVDVGRLHPGIDQPLGIGAAFVAQRIVARRQHEGGRQAFEVLGEQW